MKLVSIIMTWADTIPLLHHVIHNHLQFADSVIVVGSIKSNHGTSSAAYSDFVNRFPHNTRVHFEWCEPNLGMKPLANETRKRNHGLMVAKSLGFTHFIIADSDEFYEAKEMSAIRDSFTGNGYVHPVRAYITPTLYCDDHTLVCGIHVLKPEVYCGNYPYYPFAYDNKNEAHIDPSRRLPFRDGIQMSNALCHHYTLVRANVDMKINHSTATSLRKFRDVVYDDVRNAKPGYKSKLYHTEMKESENLFNLAV